MASSYPAAGPIPTNSGEHPVEIAGNAAAQVSIYGLFDPRNGELRYVGRTARPRPRMQVHIDSARNGEQSYRARWIRTLFAAGLRPEMDTLELVSRADADEAEAFWISYFRSIGSALTNAAIGGGPGPRGYRHTPEAIARMSAAMRGKKKSPETRARMSLAQIGNKKALGLKRPPAFGAAVGALRRGTHLSAETKAKISATKRARRLAA